MALIHVIVFILTVCSSCYDGMELQPLENFDVRELEGQWFKVSTF